MRIDVEIELDEKMLLEEVDPHIQDLAEKISDAALKNLLLADKYVFGWLWASLIRRKIEDGHYEIHFDCDYASVVEFGRSKESKFPPPDAILMWLMAKFDYDLHTARNLVYVVSRKIAKEGIDAYPFLRMAVNEVLDEQIFSLEESWRDFEEEEEEEEEE